MVRYLATNFSLSLKSSLPFLPSSLPQCTTDTYISACVCLERMKIYPTAV